MSRTFSVSPRDVGKYEAALGRSFYKTIRDTMKAAASLAIEELVDATLEVNSAADGTDRMKEIGAVDRTKLVRGFKVTESVGAMSSPATNKSQKNGTRGVRCIEITVTNNTPYYKYVVEGRKQRPGRPNGMPPPDAIEAWLVSRHGWDRKKAHDYAFVLARRIQSEGMAKRPIVDNAMPDIKNFYQDEIVAALRAWVSPRGGGR